MKLLSLLVLPLAVTAIPLATTNDVVARDSTSSALGSIFKAFSGDYYKSVFDAVVDEVLEVPANKETILDLLKADPQYSKITKLIEIDGLAEKYLNTANNHVTFFAPNNDAFPKRHDHDEDDELIQSHAASTILDKILELETLETLKGDDKDDEERKKKFRKILRGVLQYHMSDSILESQDLIKNSTIATGLRSHLGALLGEQQRIKITRSLLPIPTVELNGYAKVVKADGKASNGVLHGISAPLFPPLDIFTEAFLLPKIFSTSTSALQKTHLDELLTYSHKEGYLSGDHHGPPAVSAFVPSNVAWNELPEKLSFFLFSPFGTRALTRLLEYHVVPTGAFYTETVISKRHPHHQKGIALMEEKDKFHYFHNATVPSAAKGHDLVLSVKKTLNPLGAAEIDYKVNGMSVTKFDVPARQGVISILDSVLIPEGRTSWAGWDEGGHDSWFAKWVHGKSHDHDHKHKKHHHQELSE